MEKPIEPTVVICYDERLTEGKKVDFLLTKLMETINEDAEFRIAAAFWDARLKYASGERSFMLVVRNGEVVEVIDDPNLFNASTVSVAATPEIWAGILAQNPAPMFQDLFSAQLYLGLRIEGDIVALYTYYAAMRRITDLMRVLSQSTKA